MPTQTSFNDVTSNAPKAKTANNPFSTSRKAKRANKSAWSSPVPGTGWRNPTIRDVKIIDTIKTNPGLTPVEIAQISVSYPSAVHDCLFYTRIGRSLAEGGKISIPRQGRVPRWARTMPPTMTLLRRPRACKLATIALAETAPPQYKQQFAYLGGMIDDLDLHVSPRILNEKRGEISSVMTMTAMSHAESIASLKKELALVTANMASLQSNLEQVRSLVSAASTMV